MYQNNQHCNINLAYIHTFKTFLKLFFLLGPDWKWGDQNGDEESIGTVYHVKNRNEVYVRHFNLGDQNQD